MWPNVPDCSSPVSYKTDSPSCYVHLLAIFVPTFACNNPSLRIMANLACRTGVIFCNVRRTEAKARWPRSASRSREEEREKINSPPPTSRVTRVRAHLTFLCSPKICAKIYAFLKDMAIHITRHYFRPFTTLMKWTDTGTKIRIDDVIISMSVIG